MNRPLKIALGHVRHYVAGKHSSFMPVGIGYIGAYTISQLGAENVDVRLYDNPDNIDDWQPDIVGLTHYCYPVDYRVSCKTENASTILADVRAIHGGDAALTLTRFLESWSPDTLWRKCEPTGDHGHSIQ